MLSNQHEGVGAFSDSSTIDGRWSTADSKCCKAQCRPESSASIRPARDIFSCCWTIAHARFFHQTLLSLSMVCANDEPKKAPISTLIESEPHPHGRTVDRVARAAGPGTPANTDDSTASRASLFPPVWDCGLRCLLKLDRSGSSRLHKL